MRWHMHLRTPNSVGRDATVRLSQATRQARLLAWIDMSLETREAISNAKATAVDKSQADAEWNFAMEG